MTIGRRAASTIHYFLNYPVKVKPYLPPGTFVDPPAEYYGPRNIYGQVRQRLNSLGVLRLARRAVGLRVVMSVRHFFTYSSATPSEAHFRYVITPYQAPDRAENAARESRALAGELPFGVNLIGYLRSEKGLGQAARNLLNCAHQIHLPIAAYSIDTRDLEQHFSPLVALNSLHPPYSINVIGVNADQTFLIENLLGKSFYQGRYNIAYWFWELAQFPKQWGGAFELYDEIWVATHYVQEAIQGCTTKPVSLLPMSIDFSLPANSTRADFGLPQDAFLVLYMFDALGTFERKNPLGVIEAFRQAFDAQQRQQQVRLVIKAVNLRNAPNETAVMLDRLTQVNGILIDANYSREQTNALISHCDTYMSLHRSEGYGLTMAEAMYLGKPVIATAYSGNLDFMNADNSYLVPYHLVELQKHFGLYEQNNVWAEPDLDTAAQILRRVYADPERARQIGLQAAKSMREAYNPQRIGQQISQRLAEIDQITREALSASQ
ncbi:MAG: glycosyltransferase [Chloroflexota bacterium]